MKMHTNFRIITLGLLLSVMFLGTAQIPVAAQNGTDTPSQVVDPFVEMKPGIYVAWDWWNSTGSLSENYSNLEDYRWPTYYYEVEDIYGHTYYINASLTYVSDYSWNDTSLLVSIILDPDASLMAYLANNPNYSGDIWDIYWYADPAALTGDEVLVYSLFYFTSFDYYSYISNDYVWYDESWNEVNASDIIPILSEEYQWASYMNESIEYESNWHYSGYGYDVNEMFQTGNTSLWMEHYFAGLSIFNDTNHNGVMDVNLSMVDYDIGNNTIPDYSYYVINNTEKVYDFIAYNGTLGTITTPHLNDDGEIEWGAEVTNISGALWGETPIFLMDYSHYQYGFPGINYDPYTPIPVTMDSLAMTYRFDVKDDAAVLKIDQYMGDFTDPQTHGPVAALQGLGLTLDYWSSISIYSIAAEPAINYQEPSEPTEPYTTLPDPSDLEMADPLDDGQLGFITPNMTQPDLHSVVSFGGTYVWGKDGATYQVGTAIMPDVIFAAPYFELTPTDSFEETSTYSWTTFYYSSCYSNWDGYSITHDPLFLVYPDKSPAQVSQLIDIVLLTSVGIGLVSVVSIALVVFRAKSLRNSV